MKHGIITNSYYERIFSIMIIYCCLNNLNFLQLDQEKSYSLLFSKIYDMIKSSLICLDWNFKLHRSYFFSQNNLLIRKYLKQRVSNRIDVMSKADRIDKLPCGVKCLRPWARSTGMHKLLACGLK